MKPLSPSENSSLLLLRIQGVQHKSQLPAVERLREIEVPENLIGAATMAQTQEEMDAAEEAIIQWASFRSGHTHEDVLKMLNGSMWAAWRR